jgi:hypothetical protein
VCARFQWKLPKILVLLYHPYCPRGKVRREEKLRATCVYVLAYQQENAVKRYERAGNEFSQVIIICQ